jgi:hypothetical protein
MAKIEAEAQMFGEHLARVAGRSACQPRPELTNFGEMGRLVLDPFVEHRTNQSVPSNIRVKMSKQRSESLLASDPIKKALAVLIHFVERKNFGCRSNWSRRQARAQNDSFALGPVVFCFILLSLSTGYR